MWWWDTIINKFTFHFRSMSDFSTSNSDLERFSEYLGFIGIDADLFYEAYYLKDSEEIEEQLDLIEDLMEHYYV